MYHICFLVEIYTTFERERSGSEVECLTRDRGAAGFEPHRRHCVVSLSKNINPSLVLVQPRKTRPFITERLLMGHKESNKKTKQLLSVKLIFSYPFISVGQANGIHCQSV